MEKSGLNLGVFGLFKGCQDRQRKWGPAGVGRGNGGGRREGSREKSGQRKVQTSPLKKVRAVSFMGGSVFH